MSDFEHIVRPFVARRVTPPTRIIESEKPVEDVKLTVGGGSGFVWTWELLVNQQPEVDDIGNHFEETKRENGPEPVRVENPDDPEQYVMVEWIKEWHGRSKLDPRRTITMSFKDWDKDRK